MRSQTAAYQWWAYARMLLPRSSSASLGVVRCQRIMWRMLREAIVSLYRAWSSRAACTEPNPRGTTDSSRSGSSTGWTTDSTEATASRSIRPPVNPRASWSSIEERAEPVSAASERSEKSGAS
ncbi:hypothetical protein AB4039_06225 [Streptomyces sp. M-16]|uniref:hypothetical protein n=1 Tax=Streptomyces sp. M-16 TaxID=3233040 RepID=UPI003F969C5D